MSKKITVFQALENRDNPDFVEEEGPFICKWSNAWLGTGYYFWETFINSAHWWGKVRLANNYFICEAYCELTYTNCFDLAGDSSHMQDFSNAIDEMRVKGMITNTTTVSRILHYLQNNTPVFTYKAIRAIGWTSIGEYAHPEHIYKMLFEPTKPKKQPQYMYYKPPIQICLLDKKAMGLNGYHVIYPDEYNAGYVL